MMKSLRCLAFAALAVGVASTASAGELKITMTDGRVTVIAQDVPVRQILAEWARIGNTKIVNAEKLGGGPITLQLVDVPEKEALDILLRSAAGYLTASRPSGVEGASLYDRVIILATSRPPASGPVTTPPPAFGINRQPAPVLPQPPPDDDPSDNDQGPVPPVQPPGTQPFPGPMIGPNGQPIGPNGQPIVAPGQQQFPGNQMPVTSPRPGQLPVQPQPQLINPYTPVGPDGRPITVPGRPGGPGGGQ